ncbi:hypothetical protein yc1106_01274 [Curvularia clavata]|uniref:BZIP domain-containing protein n=1 Tax=Curvularia clavata TaxID=95742 RepID=A0A9Q8Z2K3_CURCL|nr:hypothetical protein yc1106_01274 [Curvularia clavata]
MTTTVLFPLHNRSFVESVPYAQAISAIYEWNSTPWSIVQQGPQKVLASQPPITPNPIPTANVNPIVLSAPVSTPANQTTGYHDSPSSTSPSKSHFDTSSSASPISQDIYPHRDSLYQGEDASSQQSSSITTPAAVTAFSSGISTTHRRRNTEYVEPGSARAIYLEKNRRAASKCRSKQKHEQELLVERSRLFERKNRLLKADRDLLQAEVRALKDLLV